MARSPRRHWASVAGASGAVIVVLLAWLHWPSGRASGDPGGKVMVQLVPVVTALPGYATGAVPWVGVIPQSLTASYAIRLEPRQDSCDGMAGTQGWSQVVVQAGFQWSEGLPALVASMDGRLATLGWSPTAGATPSGPSSTVIVPTGRWTKTLRNGSPAVLTVTDEGGEPLAARGPGPARRQGGKRVLNCESPSYATRGAGGAPAGQSRPDRARTRRSATLIAPGSQPPSAGSVIGA